MSRADETHWRILVSAPYAMPIIERYQRELEAAGCEVIVADVRERLEEEQLLAVVGDVDGIICGDDRITDRVLAAAPRLKVISKWGTGIDSIDKAACARRGVKLCNTPNAFSEPVADTVFGYMLLFARRLDSMDRDIRGGTWRKPQSISLRELTLGIIGVGNCGKAVARRAPGFGMTVLGHDVVEMPADFVRETGIQMVSKEELLSRADVVTMHTDLTSSSYHLINRDALARMKPTALLINTSRGPTVDECALEDALASGAIAAAALDVFEVEPLPADSRLRQLSNCWLAPHNANSSPLAAERVHQCTIANLLDALAAAPATR